MCCLTCSTPQAIFGGRIDNAFNHGFIQSFIKHLFCDESFNIDFSLNLAISPEHCLASLEGRTREEFMAWLEALRAKGESCVGGSSSTR